MFKKSLLAIALSLLTLAASAHQLWLERDGGGAVRVYVGDADGAPDTGDEVAGLAGTTRVFTTDRPQPATLKVHPDHLEAAISGVGDVRLFNDQVWKPWKNKEGQLQGVVFSARAGRTETRAGNDFELVPAAANGDSIVVTFKGQPLAGKQVTVVSPEKWTKTLKADAQGRVKLPAKEKGRYVLISSHDVIGEHEVAGQKVDKTTYNTTLSYVLH